MIRKRSQPRYEMKGKGFEINASSLMEIQRRVRRSGAGNPTPTGRRYVASFRMNYRKVDFSHPYFIFPETSNRLMLLTLTTRVTLARNVSYGCAMWMV